VRKNKVPSLKNTQNHFWVGVGFFLGCICFGGGFFGWGFCMQVGRGFFSPQLQIQQRGGKRSFGNLEREGGLILRAGAKMKKKKKRMKMPANILKSSVKKENLLV